MANPADKRSEERFPANAASVCAFASPVIEDFGPVKIKNISQKGVGLIAAHRLEVGELMAVKLANPVKNFTKTALVRIAHVTPQPGNTYLIGGDFDTPLTYEELGHFVM